jgi:hypothetical protein
MGLSRQDIAELTRLEEAMWQSATRYDPAFQALRFAVDFMEFGRSGRVYAREQVLRAEHERTPIHATLPLDALHIRALDENTVQLTYNSHVACGGVVEHARRSSLWTRTEQGWVMRFHQGTPYQP